MQCNFEPMRKQVEAWQRSKLTDVTAKIVIYETFVKGQLEAPKHLARTVHDLYFEPEYEEFSIADYLESLQGLHVGVQGTGADSPMQGDGELGRVPGDEVLTVFLARMAVPAGPPLTEGWHRARELRIRNYLILPGSLAPNPSDSNSIIPERFS